MSNSKRIFGAFTIGVALFFLWPATVGGWQKVNAFRAAVAEREQLLDARTAILANTTAAYQDYQTKLTGAAGQKFAEFVPVHKDMAEIVSALQAIATESGMQLTEVRPSESKTVAGEAYKTLSLSIDSQGGYPSVRQFLTRLEQYVRLLNVQTIEVTTDPNNAAQLRFVINAEAYFIQ